MAGFGIRLVRSAGMEGFTGNTFEYPVDPADTNPIFIGDPVKFGATGFIQEATGLADNDDFDVLGIFMGVEFVDAEGSVKYRQFWSGEAGATKVKAKVATLGHSRFKVKGSVGATYTQANTVGKRFGVAYEAGSTQYGDSRATLGAVAAATGPLLVHGLVEEPENDWGIAEPTFEVSIVRPQGAA